MEKKKKTRGLPEKTWSCCSNCTWCWKPDNGLPEGIAFHVRGKRHGSPPRGPTGEPLTQFVSTHWKLVGKNCSVRFIGVLWLKALSVENKQVKMRRAPSEPAGTWRIGREQNLPVLSGRPPVNLLFRFPSLPVTWFERRVVCVHKPREVCFHTHGFTSRHVLLTVTFSPRWMVPVPSHVHVSECSGACTVPGCLWSL